MAPSLATTISTSSPSAPAAAALGLLDSLPISALPLPSVSFLSPPYLPKLTEALVERACFVDVYQRNYLCSHPNILTNLKRAVVLDGNMKLNPSMIGAP